MNFLLNSTKALRHIKYASQTTYKPEKRGILLTSAYGATFILMPMSNKDTAIKMIV